MSSKIKRHSLQFLFQIFSFLADKTGGCSLFVKPKLLIGSVIIAASAYGQNATIKKDSTNSKPVITVEKDSIESEVEEVVFCYVTEKMPIFPGGDAELFKFISTNIQYPNSAIKNKLQGKVIVQFTINANGKIENTKVVRSLSTDCDNEAIRLVNKFPQWTPGQQRGKNVAVKYTLPINFKLTDKIINTDLKEICFVEQMPIFPGGDLEMFKFIQNNMKIRPVEMCYAGISGRVVCKFIVERNGNITNIEIVRSLDSTLDKEAVRIIQSMPKWVPGKQNGKAVRVNYILPINFKPF